MRNKEMWGIIIAVLLPLTMLAQTERWVYRYNGPANGSDYANSIVYGLDGNIYAAGGSWDSSTNVDFIVISLTATGDTNWTYRYNGPGNYYDYLNSIVYGLDGNIYAAGFSTGNGTSCDITAISLTSTGDTNWVYRYDGAASSWEGANSIMYGSDGNIYVAGMSLDTSTYFDLTVMSLTASGDTNWVYRYDGPASDQDEAFSIVYGLDGNVYAAGNSYGSSTKFDLIVISLTAIGDTNWVYRYNGSKNDYDDANSIIYGLDGNIYAAGTSWDSAAYFDFIVISLTAAGDTNWTYRYNGSADGSDGANSIVYGLDGNIYIAGWSTESSYDFTVISLSTTGQERWVYTYDGPANEDENAYSIVYGSDGNLYIAGRSTGIGTYDDFTIVSLDTAGNERWVYRYNGSADSTDKARSIVYGADGNIYAAGYSWGSGTASDFTVISLNPTTGDTNWVYIYDRMGVGVKEKEFSPSSFEPPSVSTIFRNGINIRFSEAKEEPLKVILYNVLGRSVFEKSLPYTPSLLTIQDGKIRSLASGVYFLSISSSGENIGKAKLIIAK